MSNYGELLPIGSVVLLKGGSKRLMICGRIQAKAGDDVVYDYTGCYFPEGVINSNEMFFFNRDSIETLFFIGCQDSEELVFRDEVLSRLGDLEVRDGQIVSKETE